MAGSTPIYGIPYPEATDLVADYPALGASLANTLDDKLPTLSPSAPSAPSVGQVWIDSSGASPIGKVWDGAAWTVFSGGGAAVISDTPTGTYTDVDGDWAYWEYTASGSLTVTTAGFADVLVVGGGGGGGVYTGGGGGAGGYLYAVSQYFATGNHTVTIGAGAPGLNWSAQTPPKIGNPSSIGGVFTAVGGMTGNSLTNSGFDGASGAGGAGRGTTTGGNAFFASAGSAGGGGVAGGAGGGGGAGAVGATGTGSVGGNGGSGVSNSITGSAVYYAGGGGGGASGGTAGSGGLGGGGNATNSTATGGNGTANTGGGGGGTGGTSSTSMIGGNGGSGVVIVRVRTP